MLGLAYGPRAFSPLNRAWAGLSVVFDLTRNGNSPPPRYRAYTKHMPL